MQVECAERTRAEYSSAQEALRAKQQASAGADGQAGSQHAQGDRWPLHGGDLPVFGIPGIHISLPTAVGPVSFSPLFLSKEQLDRTWVSCPRSHYHGIADAFCIQDFAFCTSPQRFG